MANLKNYTSTVPASTSMGNIEKALVEAGATDVSKKFENQVCVAFRFRMELNNSALFFELPARVNACYRVLSEAVKRPNAETEKRLRAQAERTTWKILCDWVLSQVSMIQLEQAELMQVFLPYAYDPVNDQTYYEKLKQSGFKALLPPSTK